MGLSSVNVKQLQSVPALSSPDEVSSARFTSKADIDATQTDVCFVPIADMLESRGLQQSGRPRIRFLQKQGRKLFVFAQEFFDVILHLNTGMDNRPKMSGSDKRKKR